MAKSDDVVIHRVGKKSNKKSSGTKPKINSDKQKYDRQFGRNIKILSVGLMIVAFFVLLALVSYTPADEAFLNIELRDLFGLLKANEHIIEIAEQTHNWLGLTGAYIANYLYNYTFGYAVIFSPVILFLWALDLFKLQKISEKVLKNTMLYLIFGLLFAGIMGVIGKLEWIEMQPKEWSGIVGYYIASVLYSILGGIGSLVVLGISALVTAYYGFDIQPDKIKEAAENISANIAEKRENAGEAKGNSILHKITSPYRKLLDYTKREAPGDEIPEETEAPQPKNIATDTPITAQAEAPGTVVNSEFANTARIVRENIGQDEEIKLNLQDEIPETQAGFVGIRNHSIPIAESVESQPVEVPKPAEVLINRPKGLRTVAAVAGAEAGEIMAESAVASAAGKINIDLHKDMAEIARGEELLVDKKTEVIAINPAQTAPIAKTENMPIEINDEQAFDSHENDAQVSPIQALDTEIYAEDTPDVAEIESAGDAEQSPSERGSQSKLNLYVNEPVENEVIPMTPKSPISVMSLIEAIRYTAPKINLLTENNEEIKVDEEELKANAKILQEKLETFKIYIENLTITPGPVVTQYEFVPAAGIKISKISNLADDIAMALKAPGIRIISPIPGKGTVGIEIPNKNPALVHFSSIIRSPNFYENHYRLPLALGKTISGDVYIADLAKMPHLLIAGSTGSGKSVGINTIICSLLYKMHPRDLKFVIIDPKKVELRQYEVLERHFLALSPDIDETIITEPDNAVTILKALCAEMDNRYDILASVGQRNISDYNEKVRDGKIKDTEEMIHRPMPYIVAVVDELADLMLKAGKEVETPIIRLAQLARAVGIHLVVATQRPSVDVITGIIKANFPARVAYLVASKIDSRTILDVMGAEQLLGNGDMLILTGNSPKPIRVQNAFISTDEVEAVCDYIGNQKGFSEPYYLPSVQEESAESTMIDKDDRDPLFEEAAKLVIRQQTASVSLLQRRLKIGYARAGRIVDQLEAAGVISQFDGSKSRSVYLESEIDLQAIL